LLARIVPHHANFAADHRSRGIQRQFRRLDETQFLRVVAIDAEVVNRVAVHRVELHFLAILEYGLRRHRTRRHHVPIRQYEAALRVDDESGRLRGGVPFGIESAGAVELNRHHARGDSLECLRPIGVGAHVAGSGDGRARRGGAQNPSGQQQER
jgi:hypothetical protein